MPSLRVETDGLGEVRVPADKLWGGEQTQRSLEHSSVGKDLIPPKMIVSYAIPKKAAASANHSGGRLADEPYRLLTNLHISQAHRENIAADPFYPIDRRSR